ncbi:MAG: hypothetical protein H0V44_10855 [Planctomycetes bacterium]|nr:hypothetical protein [Planctomycetota bacterium]
MTTRALIRLMICCLVLPACGTQRSAHSHGDVHEPELHHGHDHAHGHGHAHGAHDADQPGMLARPEVDPNPSRSTSATEP